MQASGGCRIKRTQLSPDTVCNASGGKLTSLTTAGCDRGNSTALSSTVGAGERGEGNPNRSEKGGVHGSHT